MRANPRQRRPIGSFLLEKAYWVLLRGLSSAYSSRRPVHPHGWLRRGGGGFPRGRAYLLRGAEGEGRKAGVHVDLRAGPGGVIRTASRVRMCSSSAIFSLSHVDLRAGRGSVMRIIQRCLCVCV